MNGITRMVFKETPLLKWLDFVSSIFLIRSGYLSDKASGLIPHLYNHTKLNLNSLFQINRTILRCSTIPSLVMTIWSRGKWSRLKLKNAEIIWDKYYLILCLSQPYSLWATRIKATTASAIKNIFTPRLIRTKM